MAHFLRNSVFILINDKAAREVGLVPQQQQLLLALKGLPAGRKATISELAERLQIQHHSTVELIDRLVKRSLIKRSRDEADQRRVIIHLTPQGEEVLRRLSLPHRHELQMAGPAFVRALGELIANDTDTAEVSQGRTNIPQKHLEELL